MTYHSDGSCRPGSAQAQQHLVSAHHSLLPTGGEKPPDAIAARAKTLPPRAAATPLLSTAFPASPSMASAGGPSGFAGTPRVYLPLFGLFRHTPPPARRHLVCDRAPNLSRRPPGMDASEVGRYSPVGPTADSWRSARACGFRFVTTYERAR